MTALFPPTYDQRNTRNTRNLSKRSEESGLTYATEECQMTYGK